MSIAEPIKFTLDPSTPIFTGIDFAMPEPSLKKHARVVFFFDKSNPIGGITVAYNPVLADANGDPRGVFADVAVAYCHPNERFSRKAGRTEALQRLEDGESIRLPIYTGGHPVRALKDMFSALEYTGGYFLS